MAVLLGSAAPAGADDDLHRWRAARRDRVRAAALDKEAPPAAVGLLIIPVDFADARFDAAGLANVDSLLARLDRYYQAASQGRTSLAMVRAPVASLAGDRQDYSDLDWQGNERSRAMASEALALAASGVTDFAAADIDGDAEVDGVLLLHAGRGHESGAGVIEALQYYLEDAVAQRGVSARVYAVCSGLGAVGIVAHETGHLLGLEDRYDPVYAGDDATPVGGLGIASLMAAGWRGTGDGADPSLPDAYSRLALGWADLGASINAGEVVRLRADDPRADEYFLVEKRRLDDGAPWDAALPAERAVVYHIDLSVPTGVVADDLGEPRHLRVELLEADGGREIAEGVSTGDPGDFFPAEGASQALDDDTIPWSRTWSGARTGVDARFQVGAMGLVFADMAQTVAADPRWRVTTTAVDTFLSLLVRLDPVPPAGDIPGLAWSVRLVDGDHGSLEGSAEAAGSLAAAPDTEPWGHAVAGPVDWWPDPDLPADAVTRFVVTVAGSAADTLAWRWDTTADGLDLDDGWPGAWRISDDPSGQSAWHRWQGDGARGLPDGPVLAATGASFTTAEIWPDVTYGNESDVTLVSPLLGEDIRWVDLTHTVDLEVLYRGRAVDGVGLMWRHDGGAEVPVQPADGWRGEVDGRAGHALAGRPTFADVAEAAGAAPMAWRRDVLPLPDPAVHGPGPWRLAWRLATSRLYRARGWLLAPPEGRLDEPPASAFPVRLDDGRLHWEWPGPGDRYLVQARQGDAAWTTVAEDVGTGPRSVALDRLDLPPGAAAHLRVLADGPMPVVSPTVIRPAVWAALLGDPAPNPARGWCQVAVDGGGDPDAHLGVYDLRGRLVRHWRPGPHPVTVAWDGADDRGRPAAAGVYVLRLHAGGRILTRKLTWLP